jgi:hypothetical protein
MSTQTDTNLYKQLVLNADSLGNALDYAVQSDPQFGLLYGKRPEFDPWRAYRVIKNDPVVKGALISIVDKFMLSGWRLEGRDSKSRQKEAESKLKELRFDRLLKRVLTQALIFKNAYVEVVKKRSEVIDLNVLETSFMKINTKMNGDVLSYSQYVGNVGTHNLPEWEEEEIVHIKIDEMNTNAWSDSDFMVLYETVLIKDYLRQFLLWVATTNQMRPVISVENKLSATKAQDFVSWIKATEKDLRKPIIVEGKTTVQPLYDIAASGGSLLDILKWCDSQILILLQVPPIVVGQADKTGRSNSVEQNAAFDTRIRALQVCMEDLFTYDLLPKMGYNKVAFKFNTLNFQRTKDIIDMVQVAKNALMSDDAIIELMDKVGLSFDTEDIFKDPAEEAMKLAQANGTFQKNTAGPDGKPGKTGNEGMTGGKDKDLMPSRTRQNDNTISKANTREMVRNSFSDTELAPKREWLM